MSVWREEGNDEGAMRNLRTLDQGKHRRQQSLLPGAFVLFRTSIHQTTPKVEAGQDAENVWTKLSPQEEGESENHQT